MRTLIPFTYSLLISCKESSTKSNYRHHNPKYQLPNLPADHNNREEQTVEDVEGPEADEVIPSDKSSCPYCDEGRYTLY
ncbi:unnamed protein product [Moneuplotes crassus]|uniref:Uncharacterized protein n=1 Tax=Euplotes crassus TaxID=5936 RepID=A0AAD1XQB7_EUPCR|nr:unnamed protein product [Moneuplotes crassus]